MATLPAGRLEPGIFQAITKNQVKFHQNFLFGSIADRLKKLLDIADEISNHY
jgi:hypothetical protein